MSHRIERGQEYRSCDPRDHIRIRVVGQPFPGVTGITLVHIATLAARGREIRRRSISLGALHATGTTPTGKPRRTGYRLVKNTDGTPAGGDQA